MIEFVSWPKIPRVENRKEFYTEKIDGTNACVVIVEYDSMYHTDSIYISPDFKYAIYAQSRKQFITPSKDNYGFATWVVSNAEELLELGVGHHYGEWWGLGIQRGYNQKKKRFSLFNTKRWGPHNPNTPVCCDVVPTIHANSVEEAKELLMEKGSLASPGFMDVEGVVIYEYQTSTYWKAIINK